VIVLILDDSEGEDEDDDTGPTNDGENNMLLDEIECEVSEMEITD